MKKKRRQRVVSILMALLMIVGLVPTDFAVTTAKAATETIDLSKGLTTGTVYGDLNVCKVEVLADMPVKADSAATVDGVAYTGFIQGAVNPSPKAGDIPTTGAAFKITAVTDSAITFVTKAAAKVYHFVDSAKKDITGTAVPDGSLKFDVKAGTTYYFYLDGSKVCVYGISITSGTSSVDWTKVNAPVLGTPVQSSSKIDVPYTGVIGDTGAEQIAVEMYNGATLVDTQISKAAGSTGTVSFSPTASGTYTFKAKLSRTGQTDIASAAPDASCTFSLPLATPAISSATSTGGGSVALVWGAVSEATGYQVSYSTNGVDYSTPISATDTTATVTGLTIGTKYTFKVIATRGTDVSSAATFDATPTQGAQREWTFSAFGQGIDTDNNNYSGSVSTKDLRLWSLGGKGKLVPASTDGLSYYYTKMSSAENFTLSATVKVNSWTFSNAQEGFGLMAADAVGKNRDASLFWNNSYMASVTKVDYAYDSATGKLFDTINGGGTSLGGDAKVTMKLGVGAQEKKGATPENIANGTITAAAQTMSTLETSAIEKGAAGGNVAGNYTNSSVSDNYNLDLTTFKLTITRNNTGYFISYTDQNGNTTTKKYYDYDRTALNQIDKDNVYVGFFASRNADISVSDVSLTTINPADDAPAEVPETTYVTPTYTVTSSSSTGIADYDFSFVANADGVLSVTDPSGNVIIDSASVKAGESVTAPTTTLNKGANDFTVTFDPNDDYIPGDYMLLSSYEPVTFTHTVNYKTYGQPGQSIWVSPSGTSKSSGNVNDPMDIYTAVKYVQPGQTIVIKEGTYNLESTVKVARGIDGTADNLISMVADPSAASRPVFDFGGLCAGMIFAGDYWYIQGFDVVNSQNAQKGIQLSGNNCTIDQVNTYHNGSTGLQISRYLTSDLYPDWPANNLILNCTSYGNADKGYEDADGFAAKLTVGDGNVFRGCISHNNADDGWDLFAKTETGAIGNVVIENCIAYSNGYLEDGTVAGNGNGFKLGGSGISGKHELRNSIAYNNKAKGIDSNNGPDIIVINSTSFNNGSYKAGKADGGNVALSTGYAKNTDYSATGIISYRTQNLDITENIKLLGTQDSTKVYGETNYYWDGVSKSVNSLGAEVSADWFTSLDTSIVPTRDADGSINMNGLLTLTDKVPANAGARLVSTASKSIVIPASVPAPKTGDVTHIYLFITLSIMSGAALVGLYFYDKKRKKLVR